MGVNLSRASVYRVLTLFQKAMPLRISPTVGDEMPGSLRHRSQPKDPERVLEHGLAMKAYILLEVVF